MSLMCGTKTFPHGIMLWPMDRSRVRLADIARALGRTVRWNGHFPVTVAEHCCRLADLAPSDLVLDALLHDAAEAYVGDVISPIKQCLTVNLEGVSAPFVDWERYVLENIYRELGVEYDQGRLLRVLTLESRFLQADRKIKPDGTNWAWTWIQAVRKELKVWKRTQMDFD